MNEQYSEKHLRKRKFWLFLPVIIIPFATIFFWLMGGGTIATTANKKSGLNLQLPNAQVRKDSAKDKLAFYLAADADSSKRLEQMRMDPYRKDTVTANRNTQLPSIVYGQSNSKTAHTTNETGAIAIKIAAIQRQIAASDRQEPVYIENKPAPLTSIQKPATAIMSSEPEMDAINGTLDKILAIQHPQRGIVVSGSANQSSYVVSTGQGTDTTYFGKGSTRKNQEAFYNDAASGKSNQEAIAAIIPTDQTLQSGSVVKLELRVPITINGISLPAGTNVFGITSLNDERLLIRIPSIRYQNSLLPVSLNVYDLDGLEGIYIPGSISREIAKASADNAIQSVGISGFDLSLKTQAAAAGIGAAKTLLSKKVKQVRVSVAAGYQVLLHDNKQSGQQ